MDCFAIARNDAFVIIVVGLNRHIRKGKTDDVDVAGFKEIVDGGFCNFVVKIGSLVSAHLIGFKLLKLLINRVRLLCKITDKILHIEKEPFVKIRNGQVLDFAIAKTDVFQHKVIHQLLQGLHVGL